MAPNDTVATGQPLYSKHAPTTIATDPPLGTANTQLNQYMLYGLTVLPQLQPSGSASALSSPRPDPHIHVTHSTPQSGNCLCLTF